MGCEKQISMKYTGRDIPSKIVMQSYISSDSVNAYIYRSLPLDSAMSDPWLGKADVWLYCNDSAYAKLYESEKFMFKLNDTVNISKTGEYKIVASKKGYKTAVSNIETLLQKVTIDSVVSWYDSTYWAGYYNVYFKDHNPGINKHKVIINGFYEGEKTFSSGEILSDEGFEKQIICNIIRHSKYDSAVVTIYTYSETFAKFDASYWEYEGSYGDYLYDDIIPVENYIENGYGFFAAREITQIIYLRE